MSTVQPINISNVNFNTETHASTPRPPHRPTLDTLIANESDRSSQKVPKWGPLFQRFNNLIWQEECSFPRACAIFAAVFSFGLIPLVLIVIDEIIDGIRSPSGTEKWKTKQMVEIAKTLENRLRDLYVNPHSLSPNTGRILARRLEEDFSDLDITDNHLFGLIYRQARLASPELPEATNREDENAKGRALLENNLREHLPVITETVMRYHDLIAESLLRSDN